MTAATTNALGQPIGAEVPNWTPRDHPPKTPMAGRTCTVVPASTNECVKDLFAAYSEDPDGRNWTYLPYGPFETVDDFQDWFEATCLGDDPLFHVIFDGETNRAVGLASYLRINPSAGSIEVGHIHFAPALQGTVAATEAMYLMMRRAFDELGYRRYEWKCNAANAASMRAAERLGFTFEGTHRQALVVKGRNRDTAWFSILDGEWPRIREAMETWLSPDNFEEAGTQKEPLSDLMAERR